MFKKVFAVVTMLSFVLSGCASIVSDSKYPVAITSAPEGARFTIEDKMGTVVHSGITPATITLKASDGFFSGAKYKVTYEKAGYNKETTIVDSDVDGWYIANILFGGLIGLLIIDPITGAMYKLPEKADVSLQGKRAANDTAKTLTVVTIDDLTDAQRAQLIRIN